MTKFNFERKLNNNVNIRNTHNYFEYKGDIYMKRDFVKKYSPDVTYDGKKLRETLKNAPS